MIEYKGYNIVGDGTFGYKQVKPIGKGSVHLALRGNYTDHKAAMRAIDRVVAEKGKKGAQTD